MRFYGQRSGEGENVPGISFVCLRPAEKTSSTRAVLTSCGFSFFMSPPTAVGPDDHVEAEWSTLL